MSTAPATKKAKKSTKPEAGKVKVVSGGQEVAAKTTLPTAEQASTKKARKRAADFLDEEPEAASATAPPKKKDKKVKAAKVEEPSSLTVDGANGIVEHSDDEGITITTTKKPKQKSMMAEAARTQDQELEDEFGNGDADDAVDEEVDAAPALLTGFDSDNDDLAEDKDFDASRVQPIPQYKKTSKKLRKAKESKNDGPGVVYVGRIPHGFYESQMKEYFSQFGNITRLRLSRNKKTGASKHFAFIEFDSDEVAKIVAETMDNYLMFGHILKCKHAPEGTLHEDVWKGANKKFRKLPHHKLARERAERPKTEEQIAKKMTKEQKKRERKAKQLKDMGYEYDLPELKKPEADVEPLLEAGAGAEPKPIEDKVEGAIVPPATVPKDELATKVEADAKKSKREKKPKVIEDKVEGAIVPPAMVPKDELAAKVEAEVKKPKKEKKPKKAEGAPSTVENTASMDKPLEVKKPKVKADSIKTKHEPVSKPKELKSILKKSKKA